MKIKDFTKILITGPPRCGKSTLVKELINYFEKKGFKIAGFLTPEIRKNNKRIGFDVEDIKTKKRIILAREMKENTNYRVGKYAIYIDVFEKYMNELMKAIDLGSDIIIIDEIGKMELLSMNFKDFLLRIFNSENQIIATIGQNIRLPIIDDLLKSKKVELIRLMRKNKNEIFKYIISCIAK
ncbi:MAG: NTPase [Promethearchaeota archaeon]